MDCLYEHGNDEQGSPTTVHVGHRIGGGLFAQLVEPGRARICLHPDVEGRSPGREIVTLVRGDLGALCSFSEGLAASIRFADNPPPEPRASVSDLLASPPTVVEQTDRRHSDAQHAVDRRVEDYTVGELVEHASVETDVASLQKLLDAETAGQDRPGVVNALTARIRNLTAA